MLSEGRLNELAAGRGPSTQEVAWLVTEIRRLRNIERQAAMYFLKRPWLKDPDFFAEGADPGVR